MKNLENQNKSYGDEAKDFHDKEIPKMDYNHTCLAVIGLDSRLNKDGNCYLEVFLNTLKKKLIRHINDALRDFSYFD